MFLGWLWGGVWVGCRDLACSGGDRVRFTSIELVDNEGGNSIWPSQRTNGSIVASHIAENLSEGETMTTSRQSQHVTVSNPQGLYDPSGFGYSHVAEVTAGSRMVFIAGQGGEFEDGTHAEGYEAQVKQAFHNLLTALRSVGAEPKDVAKLTVYIVDNSAERLEAYGAELAVTWGEAPKPTCTVVGVPRLALDDMLFEVEAVAVLPS